MEHHIDPDRVERKDDKAIRGFVQYADVKQRMHVTMHGLYVTLHPARGLADC
jgi:hypothetical protein